MKKVLFASLATLFLTLSANATSGKMLFTKDNGQSVGGIVGDTIIYIYKRDDLPAKGTENAVSAGESVSVIAKKKICSDPDMKKTVDTGFRVQFIYVSPEFDRAMISIVDSCN